MAQLESFGGQQTIVICRDTGKKRRRWEFRPLKEIVEDLNEVLRADFGTVEDFGCCSWWNPQAVREWPRDRRGAWNHVAVYVTAERGGDHAWHVSVEVGVWRRDRVLSEKVFSVKVFESVDLAWRIARRTAELLGAV